MTRESTFARFTSRKFLLALLGQITGLIVLFLPEHADKIEAAATNIGALLLMALSSFGFIQGEASIDAAREAGAARVETAKAEGKAQVQVAEATPEAKEAE